MRFVDVYSSVTLVETKASVYTGKATENQNRHPASNRTYSRLFFVLFSHISVRGEALGAVFRASQVEPSPSSRADKHPSGSIYPVRLDKSLLTPRSISLDCSSSTKCGLKASYSDCSVGQRWSLLCLNGVNVQGDFLSFPSQTKFANL